MENPVITSGGSNLTTCMFSGLNRLNPLMPPKYISPDLVLQNACTLNSFDCKPSGNPKFQNCLVTGLKVEMPLLVLIQRFCLSSCKSPNTTLSGSPLLLLYTVNCPVTLFKRFKPERVAIHRFLLSSSSTQLT